jgi:hypothetical protein
MPYIYLYSTAPCYLNLLNKNIQFHIFRIHHTSPHPLSSTTTWRHKLRYLRHLRINSHLRSQTRPNQTTLTIRKQLIMPYTTRLFGGSFRVIVKSPLLYAAFQGMCYASIIRLGTDIYENREEIMRVPRGIKNEVNRIRLQHREVRDNKAKINKDMNKWYGEKQAEQAWLKERRKQRDNVNSSRDLE